MDVYIYDISKNKNDLNSSVVNITGGHEIEVLTEFTSAKNGVLFILIDKFARRYVDELSIFRVKIPFLPIILITRELSENILFFALRHRFWDVIELPKELTHFKSVLEELGKLKCHEEYRNQSKRNILFPDEKTISSHGKMHRAIVYIEENYGQCLRPEDIAFVCNMSLSTLYREFKKTVGMSVSQYVRDYRLRLAHNELRQNRSKSISHVANQYAFSDTSHFIRQFKSKYGVTPGVVRKRENSPTS